MEYVVKEEARKVADRELKKARQLRQAQVRQQTVIWTEETRKKFEVEKERQIQLLANALTAQAQANVMARIEQINVEHDLAMAQVGAAHRAAAELRDSQKMKELKKLKNVEIAKQRGNAALKTQSGKVDKQKERNIAILLRKKQVRDSEDLKSKDLIQRRPFTISNAPVTSQKILEKKYGPPEYQQSRATMLRLAPSHQGQENTRTKSPLKSPGKSLSRTKDRRKSKPTGKFKEQEKNVKQGLRPPIGKFAKEVERRQSGLHASDKIIEKPAGRQVPKKTREQQSLQKPVTSKTKPVIFYDSSIPHSEVKYMPPPGLVERVRKEEGTLNAWETAEELIKESAQNLRNEEQLNQQRERLVKQRGDKALGLERLSRELKQLTEELIKTTDGIEIPNYSLASAQLGLEDPEEETYEDTTDRPTKLEKSIEIQEKSLKKSEGLSRSSLQRSSIDTTHDSKVSSDSLTEYYSPSSRDESLSHDSEEIENPKWKLFKTDELTDRAESAIASILTPDRLSSSIHQREVSQEIKEKTVYSSPPKDKSKSSQEQLISQTSDSNGIKLSPIQRTPKVQMENRRLIDQSDLDVPVQIPTKEVLKQKSTNGLKSSQILAEKSTPGSNQQGKLSSGSTTEYYSPPYTSTPDGSKSRISEASIFKRPLGANEGKALRRYVTKMLHMRRESVEHLHMSGTSSSSSENSKVIADSFQSEWSSIASSVHGSPSSVSSKNDISSPKNIGNQFLHSVTEEEAEESYSTAEHPSSGSTVANISLKIHPLPITSVTYRRSHELTNIENSTPLARPSISDNSLADKLEFLSEHQIKTISPHELLNSSSESSAKLISFSKNSTGNRNKTRLLQTSSSDERSIPDLSPILAAIRIRGLSTQQSESSKNLDHGAENRISSMRPGSSGSSNKEMPRGVVDNSGNSYSKMWQSPQPPVYNVTEHAELLSSAFGELRNQWANISIERPPWCI